MTLLAQGSHESRNDRRPVRRTRGQQGQLLPPLRGWPGFVSGLLGSWERESTLEVKEAAERIDAVGTKFRILAALIDTIPHDAEVGPADVVAHRPDRQGGRGPGSTGCARKW